MSFLTIFGAHDGPPEWVDRSHDLKNAFGVGRHPPDTLRQLVESEEGDTAEIDVPTAVWLPGS